MKLTMQKANVKFNNVDIGEATMVEMTVEPEQSDIPAPAFSMEGEFNIALANGAVRKLLGYGLVHDIKRPLDLEALRADYRAHKIELGHGATIERYVPAKQLYTFMVPVLISRTLADPFKPARAIQFYVRVKAEDVNMAAHLAGSIVRHKWATPRHSVNISINGTISY